MSPKQKQFTSIGIAILFFAVCLYFYDYKPTTSLKIDGINLEVPISDIEFRDQNSEGVLLRVPTTNLVSDLDKFVDSYLERTGIVIEPTKYSLKDSVGRFRTAAIVDTDTTVFGLIHFSVWPNSPMDFYYLEEKGEVSLTLICKRRDEQIVSPTCSMHTIHHSGLSLTYFFSLRGLPEWRQINQGVSAYVDSLLTH